MSVPEPRKSASITSEALGVASSRRPSASRPDSVGDWPLPHPAASQSDRDRRSEPAQGAPARSSGRCKTDRSPRTLHGFDNTSTRASGKAVTGRSGASYDAVGGPADTWPRRERSSTTAPAEAPAPRRESCSRRGGYPSTPSTSRQSRRRALELRALGVPAVPAVVAAAGVVHGWNPAALATLLGVPYEGAPRLSTAALAERLDRMLAAAGRLIAGVEPRHLTLQHPGRDRSLHQLAYHLFRLSLAFRDAMIERRLPETWLQEIAPPGLPDGPALAGYGGGGARRRSGAGSRRRARSPAPWRPTTAPRRPTSSSSAPCGMRPSTSARSTRSSRTPARRRRSRWIRRSSRGCPSPRRSGSARSAGPQEPERRGQASPRRRPPGAPAPPG